MAKLSTDVRSSIRFFAFFLANGTVDNDLLDVEEVDYSSVLLQPSWLESISAIYTNVLEVDEQGNVLNDDQARRRAAQYIRECIDRDYTVEPPWERWEIELH